MKSWSPFQRQAANHVIGGNSPAAQAVNSRSSPSGKKKGKNLAATLPNIHTTRPATSQEGPMHQTFHGPSHYSPRGSSPPPRPVTVAEMYPYAHNTKPFINRPQGDSVAAQMGIKV
eukprot:TRINITY_DN59974_c0_g1_i1.p1 TRINITY_DN59974_c0_g1~~TRINITY_DN59974_c0_g1_i1.p1  ORF type:complete len:116 (-),score=11.61 TRINITY_DN59974_c0_g1_i1:55-402(-)